MNEINKIIIPEGVNRIAVKQHDDKIVIEFIPEEPKFKRGDILKSTITPELTVIFDKMTSITSFDSIYNNRKYSNHYWHLESFRHATKEEEQEFFDELKADGKRWNTGKLIVEDIPQPVEEPKEGDLAIFWDDVKAYALIRIYGRGCHEYHYDSYGTDWGNATKSEYHYDSYGTGWKNAIKFKSKEQFEKVLRGEI